MEGDTPNQIQQPEVPILPQKKLSPFLDLKKILVVIGIIVGVSTIYFYLTSPKENKQTPQKKIAQPTKIHTVPPPKGDFTLVGSEVIQTINGQKSVLFKNVEGVSEVQIGPDKNSLHFKPAGSAKIQSQLYCANLSSVDEPAPPGYTDPPPQRPPWDFKKLGYAYTIRSCGSGSGYLQHSNYFTYLQLRSAAEGYIFFENLTSGEIKQIKIPVELLKGFTDGIPNVKGNTYWTDGTEIKGEDGYKYLYPDEDAVEGTKLLLKFGRLSLGLDTAHSRLLGGNGFEDEADNTYGIVAYAYTFLNQNSLPYIIINSQWEGPAHFAAVLDISGDMLKTVPLTRLNKVYFFDFGVEKVVWQSDSVLFNFANVEEVKIPQEILNNNDLSKLKEEEIATLSRQAETLLASQKYQKIICNLQLGQYTPLCEGLTSIDHYKYSSVTGLVKL